MKINPIILKRFYQQFKGRPDDIFITTYMKSGTTWLQMILYQLTSDGNMNFKHMYDISPFLEISIKEISRFDRLPSPRFFKTHLPYEYFPEDIEGKFLYLMRDGKDVAVSQYYHFLPLIENITFEKTFNEMFLKSSADGWFGHMAGWLKNENNFDILYIRFEDLKHDLKGNIEKIRKFCDIEVDESEFPRILERCSFHFMKRYQHKFEDRNRIKDVKLNDFIRKGKTKQGDKYFNRTLREIYSRKFKEFLADFNLDCYDPESDQNKRKMGDG